MTDRPAELARFVITPARDCASQFTPLSNGGAYRRLPPLIFGALPEAMRKRMALEAEKQVDPPEAGVALFDNVTVFEGGIVVTASGQVVAESLINMEYAQTFAGFARTREPRILTREGAQAMPAPEAGGATPMVHVGQSWDTNYGHWLIESLPRLAFARQVADLGACRILVSGAHGAMRTVYRDTVATFAIAAAQLVFWSGVMPVARLIYPLPVTRQPWVKAPAIFPVLAEIGRRLAPDGTIATAERIYVARPQTARRALRNAAEIGAIAVARGYTVVVPGRLTVADQARLFAAARRVIGVLGAELANLAFAEDGVRLLALAPEPMYDDFFYDLVSHKRGHYVSLHGPATHPELRWASDFSIDADLFRQCLDRFEQD